MLIGGFVASLMVQAVGSRGLQLLGTSSSCGRRVPNDDAVGTPPMLAELRPIVFRRLHNMYTEDQVQAWSELARSLSLPTTL